VLYKTCIFKCFNYITKSTNFIKIFEVTYTYVLPKNILINVGGIVLFGEKSRRRETQTLERGRETHLYI